MGHLDEILDRSCTLTLCTQTLSQRNNILPAAICVAHKYINILYVIFNNIKCIGFGWDMCFFVHCCFAVGNSYFGKSNSRNASYDAVVAYKYEHRAFDVAMYWMENTIERCALRSKCICEWMSACVYICATVPFSRSKLILISFFYNLLYTMSSSNNNSYNCMAI